MCHNTTIVNHYIIAHCTSCFLLITNVMPPCVVSPSISRFKIFKPLINECGVSYRPFISAN